LYTPKDTIAYDYEGEKYNEILRERRLEYNAKEIARVHELNPGQKKGTIVMCASNADYIYISKRLRVALPDENHFNAGEVNAIKESSEKFILCGCHIVCEGIDLPGRVSTVVLLKHPFSGDQNVPIPARQKEARRLVQQCVGRIRRTPEDKGVVVCLGGAKQARAIIADITTMEDAEDCIATETLDVWPFDS